MDNAYLDYKWIKATLPISFFQNVQNERFHAYDAERVKTKTSKNILQITVSHTTSLRKGGFMSLKTPVTQHQI